MDILFYIRTRLYQPIFDKWYKLLYLVPLHKLVIDWNGKYFWRVNLQGQKKFVIYIYRHGALGKGCLILEMFFFFWIVNEIPEAWDQSKLENWIELSIISNKFRVGRALHSLNWRSVRTLESWWRGWFRRAVTRQTCSSWEEKCMWVT